MEEKITKLLSRYVLSKERFNITLASALLLQFRSEDNNFIDIGGILSDWTDSADMAPIWDDNDQCKIQTGVTESIVFSIVERVEKSSIQSSNTLKEISKDFLRSIFLFLGEEEFNAAIGDITDSQLVSNTEAKLFEGDSPAEFVKFRLQSELERARLSSSPSPSSSSSSAPIAESLSSSSGENNNNSTGFTTKFISCLVGDSEENLALDAESSPVQTKLPNSHSPHHKHHSRRGQDFLLDI